MKILTIILLVYLFLYIGFYIYNRFILQQKGHLYRYVYTEFLIYCNQHIIALATRTHLSSYAYNILNSKKTLLTNSQRAVELPFTKNSSNNFVEFLKSKKQIKQKEKMQFF